MPLNRVKNGSQMYPWVDATLTILNGACPHECQFCYVNSLKQRFPNLAERYSGPPRLVENDFNLDLGSGNTIFVCSTHDLFAKGVPDELIERVLEFLHEFESNTFLLQSKNPARFFDFFIPENTILGTTIETNRDYGVSKAPSPYERYVAVRKVLGSLMVSIEPIMDFDLDVMLQWMQDISPDFVSVGADSKGYGLQEPPPEKVSALIRRMGMFTEVKLKKNIERLGLNLDGLTETMDTVSLA